MKKRALQAGVIMCVVVTSVAVWAGQQASKPASGTSTTQIESRVEQFLREFYAWGPAFQVNVDQPEASPIPGLYTVPVHVSYKGQTDGAVVYVTRDGHYVIRGAIDSLLENPYAATIQRLHIDGQPYVGPVKACVNVVEFSDFECPHCRDAHKGLEQAEQQYPKVRFTFMDFPLTHIHPWAMTAALAGRCVYSEKPALYPKFRNTIFDNQDKINPTNALTTIVGYATQLGLDSGTLRACIASPATKKLVEADTMLGAELHVNSTPTFFVNGRPMVGWDGHLIDQFITYELSQCQAGN